ncbi:Rrf2 family transcriptional regulator [Mechercharimyces sp. CAU 1602]|uniref:RrF2 family transcriptional regulator n=1 Tax=Mechercharimyces sp. CAU 1602 TaxID=2973933 RepID=UPI002161F629|nr:Rrf2 family transcriptional regulator [Mechercharimyces sp. CAU 1602]MCS1351088.1 Rrf2 family transcriptional regulator [Mechercharimyces sp. CAU 1602]
MNPKTTNTRWFRYALQALVVLAKHDGVCASVEMAGKMDSQSAYLRKILPSLVKANLIQAKEGRDGGYLLVRPPHEITVADVYEAMNLQDSITKELLESSFNQCVPREIQGTFAQLGKEIEQAIVHTLHQKTIQDFID